MKTIPPNRISNFILLFIILYVFAYCIFLQFLSSTFYESDSYYHISIARFIKDFGPHYKFPWTQFSILKDYFSDKDFFYHLLCVPFLHLNGDLVTAGKYAVIFYNIIFIFAYVFILRKYLPGYLAGCFLLLPFLSATFTSYLLYLRSFTLANILTILAVYFFITKNLTGVFFVSLIYPLSHVSFFTIVIFVVMCEVIRYLVKKEFHLRNIYVCLLGVMVGCFIHPNFPNNFLSLHLHQMIVQCISSGIDLGFGSENMSYSTLQVFLENFAVFISINVILWLAFFLKTKISFQTAVWFACTNFYFMLAMPYDRYWYPLNILFFIFFASYVKDILDERGEKGVLPKINIVIIFYLVAAIILFPHSLKSLRANIDLNTRLGLHYKNTAEWMKRNIPPGETFYHNYWSDSAYFLCFNPANNYMVVLDPIFMFYRNPSLYLFYRDLSLGRNPDPYDALKTVFKLKYGYTRKDNLFYLQIKHDPSRFRIIHEDELGVVFRLSDNLS